VSNKLRIIEEKCAIIIPTRNRPGILRDTLKKLLALGLGSVPLLVYDDASVNPEAIQRSIEVWPNAHLIRGEEQQGQAHGRNVLVEACSQEWVICLDDDVYFLDLGNISYWLSSNSTMVAALVFQCRDKSSGRLDQPQCDSALCCPSFMGGSVMFNVQQYTAVRGYRGFFIYGLEEPEFALRIYSRELKIWYDPTILVEHNHIMTEESNRDHREYHRLYARNFILMYTMNMNIMVGLWLGLPRSAKHVLRNIPYTKSTVNGLLNGICDTFRYWHLRCAISLATVNEWRRLLHEWSLK